MSITVDLMRSTGLIVSVQPNAGSSITKKLMESDIATLTFELNGMFNFNVGDYGEILGVRYYISKPPLVEKQSRHNYKYTLVMEPSRYKLRNAQYLFYNANNEIGEPDFSLTGTAIDFVRLLLLNANRVGEAWELGGVIETGYKTLTFAKEHCLEALAKIAEAFETEFFIEGNQIHLAKRARLLPKTLQYGKETGLYSITRDLVDDNQVTRLYVYGGTTNIPNEYRNFSPRLLMNPIDECLITDLSAVVTPNTPNTGMTRYQFDFTPPLSETVVGLVIQYRTAGTNDSWLEVLAAMVSPQTFDVPVGDYEFRFMSLGGSCDQSVTPAVRINETTSQLLFQKVSVIEYNTAQYGIIEGTLVVEDIFPQREAAVTAVDGTDFYKFKDASLDFDINDHLLPGLAARVVFNSGQLAGYGFDVKEYNSATKEFTLLKNKDEKILDIPSVYFRPGIGDKYILVNIRMPQSYIDAAEQQLRIKATEYIKVKSVPAFKYNIVCNPAFFRAQKIKVDVGDVIVLMDVELGISDRIRTVEVVQSLVDEYDYELTLGEGSNRSIIAELQNSTRSNALATSAVASSLDNSAISNNKVIGNLRIEQGTVVITEIPTAAGTGSMKPLYVDGAGKVWKSS